MNTKSKSQETTRSDLADQDKQLIADRIWRKDTSLWVSQPEASAAVANRLGWLDSIGWMRPRVAELEDFANRVRDEGFTAVVLLGMGGSSLAPEVLANTLGAAPGNPRLVVLDTTAPDAIRSVEESLTMAHTLFIVSSKSGTTTETASLFEYFQQRASNEGRGETGNQFVAITDPDSPLQRLAEERKFRRVFLNPSDIGGRYSALSYFGLVPAALLGIDIKALLDSADNAARCTKPEAPVEHNRALQFGIRIAELAAAGRDKLTMVLSPRLTSLGAWIEQLVAESTGKQGVGIVPVVGEHLPEAVTATHDRVFVWVRVSDPANSGIERQLIQLQEKGHPVFQWQLADLTELGGEFFRWEFATAVAAARLGINPFDEPDVADTKTATKGLLNKLKHRAPDATLALAKPTIRWVGERAQDATDAGLAEPLSQLVSQVKAGDYLAILAYLPPLPHIESALVELRKLLNQRLNVATCLAFGPRYLHSSGQLHKGGPNTGVYLQITADAERDLAIPGQRYSFQQLITAQAEGDFEVLRQRGRRIVCAHLAHPAEHGLAQLQTQLKDILKGS